MKIGIEDLTVEELGSWDIYMNLDMEKMGITEHAKHM